METRSRGGSMTIEVSTTGCDEARDGEETRGGSAELGILHLEDNEADAELVALQLSRQPWRLRITRVETRAEFAAALGRPGFDVILSDFSLPDFDGLSALATVRRQDTETPFIFVSGTIGEERAVQALHAGATDYVLKDRLSRLPAAIERALQERRERLARRAAEARIQEQAALLENAREAIAVFDLERHVTYWNRGAEQLYGWSFEEARAGAADARFPADVRDQLDAAWETVVTTGKWDGTFRQRTRDGREIIVEGHWTRASREEGGAVVLTIASDVTEARRLEARLLRAQRLETVGMLASGVAHDLNNVLAPILIGVSSLKRRVADESGQRVLATMEMGVQRGSDIVRQVVTFARGGTEPAQRVAVRDVVQGIERLLDATLTRRIRLELDIPDDLWPIECDATQLQQILLNLCVNARDAMPKGGRIRIAAENAVLSEEGGGRYVRLSVSDTGIGMPPDLRERIFEPFFTTKAQGTGIGLSTVASIIKRHGGRIEVDSTPGSGTEFRLLLPLALATPVPRARPAAAAGELPTLLVVDEGSVRELIKGTLTAYGYRVLAAEGAAQALELHGRHGAQIAAVLVNASMNAVDGVELIRKLAQQNRQVKVVNTSGLTDILGEPGVESIVRATLPKPYTADRLLDVVGQVLEMA